MHLDDEHLQRWLHDELPDATSVREHVGLCTECQRRVEQAQREAARIDRSLRHLDHDIPHADVKRVRAMARSRFRMRWYRAAGLLLAAGIAGVAWAAPQLRLPAIVARVLGRVDHPRPVPPAAAPDALPATDLSGIAVEPRGDVVIRFTALQPLGDARVWLTDRADVVIRAPAGAASFTSVDDGIVIANEGSVATFDIEIPATAARVEIRVAGRRVFLKAGPRVTAEGPPDAGGHHVVSLRSRAP